MDHGLIFPIFPNHLLLHFMGLWWLLPRFLCRFLPCTSKRPSKALDQKADAQLARERPTEEAHGDRFRYVQVISKPYLVRIWIFCNIHRLLGASSPWMLEIGVASISWPSVALWNFLCIPVWLGHPYIYIYIYIHIWYIWPPKNLENRLRQAMSITIQVIQSLMNHTVIIR
jgi:hypothetical protein